LSADPSPPFRSPEPSPAVGARRVAIDAFRGVTVAAMILVNNPGSWSAVYGPLDHAEWHGWTPTDLIFPFFLFLVGVSLPFSTRGSVREAVIRAAKIFALGFLLAFYPRFDLAAVRIPGVLARIALCYLAAFLARKYLRPAGIAALAAALLAGYWALLTFVPVPDGHLPNLGPSTNLGAWLDRMLLGGHLWSQSESWDPEGLLSTLPAIATTLLGILAGEVLAARLALRRTLLLLAVPGIALTAAGLAWDASFPINKNLWTSSYALFTAGLAALCLAAFHALTDGWGRQRWARPLGVYGVNAIVVFVASGFLAKTLLRIKLPFHGQPTSLQACLYRTLFAPYLAPENASLAYAAANVLGWYLVLLWMDRRGIRIKV
jgi:predicted acyltransferase